MNTISHAETAQRLGVTVNTVRNMILDGRLPAIVRKRAQRTRYILDRNVVEAIERGSEVIVA